MTQIHKYLPHTLPYLFVFIATLYRPLDPDLGWHLRYGKYFFTHWRILKENIFSSEMPDFIWANISWGADLFYYLFFHFGGFLSLTLAGAAIVTLTLFFFSAAYDLSYWHKAIIFPVILFFESPVNASSFRGQNLSFLLFAMLFYFLVRYEKSRGKSLYVVPVLFLFWANLHGFFLLGLAVFYLWEFLFLISVYFENKSISSISSYFKLFVLTSIASIIATLIQPFGIHIYTDALLHFNNPLLKYVSEYGTVEELSVQWYNLILVAVIAGISIGVFIFKKELKKQIPHTGIFSVLFLLSLWVRRYSWIMYYTLIPLMKPVANFLKPDSKKGVFLGATGMFMFYIIFTLFLKLPFSQFTAYSWKDYCRPILKCSPRAADTLRNYYKENETMTPYNWGGWLIWNYPGLKPSTDGRMHLWRDKKGYSGFEHDYLISQNVNDVHTSKYTVVLAAKQKPIYNRLRNLVSLNKWEKVYEDTSAAIFIRK